MPTATVTSKGQITIPAEVREALKLKPGEKVAFFAAENDEFVVRRVGSIMDLEGCLAGIEVPKTDTEMNELLHRHAMELDDATKSGARATADEEAA